MTKMALRAFWHSTVDMVHVVGGRPAEAVFCTFYFALDVCNCKPMVLAAKSITHYAVYKIQLKSHDTELSLRNMYGLAPRKNKVGDASLAMVITGSTSPLSVLFQQMIRYHYVVNCCVAKCLFTY